MTFPGTNRAILGASGLCPGTNGPKLSGYKPGVRQTDLLGDMPGSSRKTPRETGARALHSSCVRGRQNPMDKHFQSGSTW